MGKKTKDKKDKFKSNPFDYMGGGRIRELGDRYGVDHRDHNINMGRSSGSGRDYKGDRDDYDEAVRKAAMSDYDTRRTMEAQAMAGNKDAKKFAKKGFKNIGKVYEGNELMRKLHKKEGNGGSFSSASDFAGLTYKSVKADREAQTNEYKDMFASKEDLDALSQQQQAAATKPEYKPSPEIAEAKERVKTYESGAFDKGVYGGGGDDEQSDTAITPYDSSSTDAESKATSHLDKFKASLKQRKNLQPVL